MARIDGRGASDIRPLRIARNYIKFAEGSVLIELGDTRVVCTASLDDRVPPFLRGAGRGWVSAEYGMLPRATPERGTREATTGRATGRTYEIQRLIGRALRAVTDLGALGERTVWIDCDVLQADGGTRTAAVTGGFIALVDALDHLRRAADLPALPVRDFLAATSVGVVAGELLLDLRFEEDARAYVDMNVVMTGNGALVEVQGTGEGGPFSREQMDALLELARRGIMELVAAQREALGSLGNELALRAAATLAGARR